MGTVSDFCEYGDICQSCGYTEEEFGCGKCLRHPSIRGLLRRSFLPAFQWRVVGLTPEADDEESFERLVEIRDGIHDIVSASGSTNVLICGAMGSGKTSWAIKIMQRYFAHIARRAYMDEIAHGVFVPTSQFVLWAKDFSYGAAFRKFEEMRDAADKADIVIWDDIGAAEYTRHDYTNLLVPIDRRVFAGKFNIFTTNFTDYDEMVDRVGERLAYRVWSTSEIIELMGEGVRH